MISRMALTRHSSAGDQGHNAADRRPNVPKISNRRMNQTLPWPLPSVPEIHPGQWPPCLVGRPPRNDESSLLMRGHASPSLIPVYDPPPSDYAGDDAAGSHVCWDGAAASSPNLASPTDWQASSFSLYFMCTSSLLHLDYPGWFGDALLCWFYCYLNEYAAICCLTCISILASLMWLK